MNDKINRELNLLFSQCDCPVETILDRVVDETYCNKCLLSVLCEEATKEIYKEESK